MENPSELGSEEVTFLSREGWVAIKGGVQVSSENMSDLASSNNVLRIGIWELNPVVQQVCAYPEDILVYARTSLFEVDVVIRLFSLVKSSCGDPVIILGSKDLAAESDAVCTTHDS